MEGWKQTEIGIIPNDWNCSSIKEISITCKAGGTPRKNQKEFMCLKILVGTTKRRNLENLSKHVKI